MIASQPHCIMAITLAGGFFFDVEELGMKFSLHIYMVLQQGTFP
jgi:hypothetical protein